MVLGGWISWNYNQLSQAKAKAETEFGNNLIEIVSSSWVHGYCVNTGGEYPHQC